MSNFEKVRDEFNIAFGVKNNIKPQHNLFDTDPKLVEYRSALINEEVEEFNVAVANKDIIETCDALADILYVVYGAFSSFGIDGDKAFDLVHKSNMSKLCKNEEEAKLTVEFYKKEGRYDSPSYRLSDDRKHYVVYNENTKKILKSINYSPVKFDSIL